MKKFSISDNQDDYNEHSVHFRRITKKRPTKKTWLLLIMITAICYVLYYLHSNF